jgi:hypothetical protein
MTNNDSEYRIRAVERIILTVRGQKVILDADLARVYGVPTRRLNEQVKRNKERFPDDFVFELSPDEKAEVVANCDHLVKLKFSPVLPCAFTEHGAIMAATVLSSPDAVRMSVFVVRAFVKMREYLLNRAELEKRLADIEKTLLAHDTALRDVYQKIRPLLFPPPAEPPRRQIGFGVKERRARYIVKRKGK